MNDTEVAAGEAAALKRPGLAAKSANSSRRLFGDLVQRFSSANLSTGGNTWSCEYCTYKNRVMDFLSCEICGMIRTTSDMCEEEKEEVRAEEDPRYLAARAEQDNLLRNSNNNRQDEYHQDLVEERMQEIVDRQRQLYDEIAEHRVRRSSISFCLETQKSINKLQKIIEQHAFNETHDQSDASEPDPVPPIQTFTPKKPEKKTSPGPTREIVKTNASRRQLQRAQQYENPVNTMSINPWEEKSMGVQDILAVQSELWNRVKVEPKQPFQNKQALLPRLFRKGKKAQ